MQKDLSMLKPSPPLLDRFFTCLPYLHLLRSPIATGLLLVSFPFLAIWSRFSPLLANLFDITPRAMVVVSLMAFTAAWTVMTTGWVVVLHGADRFPVERIKIADLPGMRQVFFFGLAALPILICSVVYSVRESGRSIWWMVCGSLAGLAAALVLLGIVRFMAKSEASLISRVICVLAKHAEFSAGYLKLGDGKSTCFVLPGHALAFFLFGASLLVYLGVGLAKYRWLGYQPRVPTLAYVLLLMTLICWGTSGLAFFFDRFRFPVVVPLLAIPILNSFLPQSDHYFRVLSHTHEEALPPAAVLRSGTRSSAIVVAANGGGIQSAAWTTRVLTGLEQRSRAEFGAETHDFGRQVRMISSVSGGSVGAMYIVGAFSSDGLPADSDLDRLVDLAEASSLDDIAWGLVYPDLGRVIFPFFWSTYIDRGQALERALIRQTKLSDGLSQWTEGVRLGWRPAVMFNATIADTGERLLFTNTTLESGHSGVKRFRELYPGMDIQVATAARLSAAFPYVSPAARADLGGPWTPQYHVVDGGYYDNYGMSSLIGWLDEALRAPANPIRRVLLLEIRGAPSSENDLDRRRGWLYQTVAPLEAMLNVRTAGQLSHNEEELRLLKRTAASNGVEIQSAVFQFRSENPPLSWHLTEHQKEQIAREWDRMKDGDGWEAVKTFLSKAKE